jgi:hypothetical protein
MKWPWTKKQIWKWQAEREAAARELRAVAAFLNSLTGREVIFVDSSLAAAVAACSAARTAYQASGPVQATTAANAVAELNASAAAFQAATPPAPPNPPAQGS